MSGIKTDGVGVFKRCRNKSIFISIYWPHNAVSLWGNISMKITKRHQKCFVLVLTISQKESELLFNLMIFCYKIKMLINYSCALKHLKQACARLTLESTWQRWNGTKWAWKGPNGITKIFFQKVLFKTIHEQQTRMGYISH